MRLILPVKLALNVPTEDINREVANFFGFASGKHPSEVVPVGVRMATRSHLGTPDLRGCAGAFNRGRTARRIPLAA